MRILSNLSCAFFFSFLVGCTETVHGNGHLVEEVRELRNFTGVRVESGLKVEVELGEDPALKLHLDENLLRYVDAKVRGSDLVLRTEHDVRLDPSRGAKIRVRAPLIEFVDVGHGSELSGEIGGDTAGVVSVEASGGSEVDVTLRAAELDVSASGGSDVEIDGASETVFIAASGGSEVEVRSRAKRVRVDASGGSEVEAYASESATIEASGGSDVTIYGRPEQRRVDKSGDSDVSFR